VAVRDFAALRQALPLLLSALSWSGSTCVSGLPLSLLSIRNLVLPFASEKKINQILPFELEEHLPVPVAEQVVAVLGMEESGDGARLLVAAVEKTQLRDYLDIFQAAGLDPGIVCPATLAPVRAYAEIEGHDEAFVLVHADMRSLSLAVCRHGRTMFLRRLPYPEEVITDRLFDVQGERVVFTDAGAAKDVVDSICRDMQRCLEFCRVAMDLDLEPHKVILTGPMQSAQGFADCIERELGLPVRAADLAADLSLAVNERLGEDWQAAWYDRPLALALLAGRKNVAGNFRKDEFAARGSLLGTGRKAVWLALAAGLLLCVLLGYQYFSYRTLKGRHDSLALEMEQIFKKSFPDITRIVDPLMQMRARLQTVETPTVAMPLFTGEKRVLVILADISRRIPRQLTLHVSRLVIDEDSVRIKGTTDAFNNVNRIKTLLDQSELYSEVNIVSATKSRDNNSIRFEIRLQLGEQS
jgi:general secretion pathway protein L